MKPLIQTFVTLLLAPCLALAGAAPGAPAPKAAPAAVSAPAESDPSDAVAARYRSSFLYAASLLEGLSGQVERSTALLKMAADSDSGSAYLREELIDRYLTLGMGDAAVQALSRAVEASPRDTALRLRLAQAHIARKEWDAAKRQYLELLEAEPGHPEALQALGALALARGEQEEALQWLDHCLARDPGRAPARMLRAGALMQLQRVDEAYLEYRRVLRDDPRNLNACLQLGLAQETRGETGAAIGTYCQGLAASPDSAVLKDALAHACYRDERWDEAAAGFRDLAADDPDDQATRLYWGLALIQGRAWAEAEAVLAPLSPTSAAEQGLAWYGLGMAAANQGRDAAAEAWFKRMLAANPKSLPAYAQLSFLYDRLSRTAEAAALLQAGVAANPDARDLHLLLGAALTDLGDTPAAVKALERGLKACGENAAMRHQLALAWDRAGDLTHTVENLDKVVEMEPDNAEALNFLGYTLADHGRDLDRSVELLKRAVAIEPENPYFLDSLGWAWFRKGDLERARFYLDRALGRMQGRRPRELDEVQGHLKAVKAAQAGGGR